MSMEPGRRGRRRRKRSGSPPLTATELRAWSWGCVLAGADESGLVGEDDQLRPVAGTGLGQDAADVSLDGQRADHELLSDFVVGLAESDLREHVAFAFGEVG